MKTVSEAIKTLCEQQHNDKTRWRALKSIKWVLQSPAGQYAGLDGLQAILTHDLNRAQVFDGRDNETAKAAFYSALLKTSVEPVLISCAF